MLAGTYNMVCKQGSTFSLQTTFTDDSDQPINLTGYTARMQVRRNPTSTDDPVVELTTENSRIVLGGAAGTVTFQITAADTAALPVGHYFYDVELVNGAVVTPYLEGEFEIKANVTR